MELTIYRYQIPFKQPFTTAAGTFRQREGIFLAVNHNKLQALGEAAPLPGFSHETLDETVRWAKSHFPRLENFMIEQIQTLEQPPQSVPGDMPASLSFALDTLIADYQSKATGQHVRNFLYEKPSSTIDLNATLPIRDEAETLSGAKELMAQGYSTLKLKVGQDDKRELSLIRKLRERYPDVTIRVDANQGWTVKTAIEHLNKLRGTGIEYCEEPIAEPTVEKLQMIKKETGVRLALDESLYQVQNPKTWIEQQATDVIIIKPMIAGSFRTIEQWCAMAGRHAMDIVFTTSLESGVGRMMTANLASSLGSQKLAHGLATGSLLKDDLLDDQRFIKDGQFHIPNRAGIGLQLDPQKTSLKLQKLEV